MPRPNGVGDFGRWLDGTRVRTETPLAGRMLVLLQGGVGKLEGGETGRGDGATVEESGTERGKERERKREGGHLAIKNTY